MVSELLTDKTYVPKENLMHVDLLTHKVYVPKKKPKYADKFMPQKPYVCKQVE